MDAALIMPPERVKGAARRGRHALQRVDIDDHYRGGCVVLDVFNLVYRAREMHAPYLCWLVSLLRACDVRVIAVFDGRPPAAKAAIIREREERRERSAERAQRGRELSAAEAELARRAAVFSKALDTGDIAAERVRELQESLVTAGNAVLQAATAADEPAPFAQPLFDLVLSPMHEDGRCNGAASPPQPPPSASHAPVPIPAHSPQFQRGTMPEELLEENGDTEPDAAALAEAASPQQGGAVASTPGDEACPTPLGAGALADAAHQLASQLTAQVSLWNEAVVEEEARAWKFTRSQVRALKDLLHGKGCMVVQASEEADDVCADLTCDTYISACMTRDQGVCCLERILEVYPDGTADVCIVNREVIEKRQARHLASHGRRAAHTLLAAERKHVADVSLLLGDLDLTSPFPSPAQALAQARSIKQALRSGMHKKRTHARAADHLALTHREHAAGGERQSINRTVRSGWQFQRSLEEACSAWAYNEDVLETRGSHVQEYEQWIV